jgi:hypothetical protein
VEKKAAAASAAIEAERVRKFMTALLCVVGLSIGSVS